ncbi:unnamed protein product, partial [marine sediment metagenome]
SGARGKYFIKKTRRGNAYEVYATNGFLKSALKQRKSTIT